MESLNWIQHQRATRLSPYSDYVTAWSIVAVSFILLVYFYDFSRGRRLSTAPIVGASSIFEPLFVTKYRFSQSGWATVQQGYEKFKDSVFTIVRPESTVTVIPRRYVDELSNLADTKLDPARAIAIDFMGKYTGIDVLIGSHLSLNAVQTRLTPRLGSFVSVIEEELEFAMKEEFPALNRDEWSEVNHNLVILRIVSRITARVFFGSQLCRNTDWLELNINTVEEIFATAVILRHLPPLLHPFLYVCIPSYWKLRQCTKRIHQYLIPLINDRRQAEAVGESYQKPEDVLQWMMDLAKGKEREPEDLTNRYIFTIIGSMHTVTSAVVDSMYDLAGRPEYVTPLREELELALDEDGVWERGTPAKLQKMDSFMKEVQRHNPPSAVGFKRIVREPITLSNGLTLPKDTYIAVSANTHLQDDGAPIEFDGYRYLTKRLESGNPNAHQYASTDSNHIHFGHGRYACPGRFLASHEIKMILARILSGYDLKLPGIQGRPRNLTILEFGFKDPGGRVMIKRRSI